jgi:hypothetical protein
VGQLLTCDKPQATPIATILASRKAIPSLQIATSMNAIDSPLLTLKRSHSKNFHLSMYRGAVSAATAIRPPMRPFSRMYRNRSSGPIWQGNGAATHVRPDQQKRLIGEFVTKKWTCP